MCSFWLILNLPTTYKGERKEKQGKGDNMIPAVQQKHISLKTEGRGRQGRYKWTAYLFILPHLLLFAVFIGYPFFSGLVISLFRYDYLQPQANVFVGLKNYIDLFVPGSLEFQVFWNALGNTIEFVIYSVPLLVLIPLALAVLLNTKLPGRNVFRAIYFAPWVLSVAVVGLLWFWIFQSEGGLINYYLTALHLPAPSWLNTLPGAWIAIVVATVWWTMGFNMIIFLAALQDIPNELHEAAAVDGANKWQTFLQVTLPLLQPVLLFIITITIIASFNLFGQPFLMTNGGPAQSNGGGATEPIMLRIYLEGFVRHFVGSAAAMSFVVALIMIAVSYINFRVFRGRV
jgi:multiple sugar transport system permease protein